MTGRACGGCTLCCKLLPLHLGRTVDGVEIGGYHKPAGQRCQYQRTGHGCRIYQQRPWACKTWACRWLVNDDAGDLSRPDRVGYVIDVMPDFVTMVNDETAARQQIEVIQIWVDPDRRDAHRDPALRAYLLRRGMEGKAALIRFNECEGITLVPPMMSESGKWLEIRTPIREKQHTAAEIFEAVSEARQRAGTA